MAEEVAIAARFAVETRDLEYRREGAAPLLARLYRPRREQIRGMSFA
jgi:hypothetical protein